MGPLLDVRRLTVELPTPGGWIRPVNDVTFQLAPAETLGLVGESGSGKTMLSLALMGLLPAGARRCGEAWLAVKGERLNLVAMPDRELPALRGRHLAMIFQEPMTALNPVLRIGKQIAEVIRVHEPSLGSDKIEHRTLEALKRAAVPEPEIRARQYPHQLSGGLRQRAMIAMALATSLGKSDTNEASGGRLLIADEPTTALDVTVQKQILELLQRLRSELALTVLFITHDLGVVAQIADRVAVMYTGRIVEEGPTTEVLRNPQHPYTRGLLRASPQLRRHKLEPIAGSVPRLDALPPGCAFEPRCPTRRSECSAAVPDLRVAGSGHRARCILVEEPVDKVTR